MEALTTAQRATLESNEEASISGSIPTVIFIDTPDRAPWDKDYIYSGSSLSGLADALRNLAEQYDALHADGYTMAGPSEKYGTISVGRPE